MSAGVAAPARQIGDYIVEGELGRGAFGVVYRAHHRSRPDVPVALKVVEGRGNTDRLMLEPAVLSRLEHPAIVRLEDYFLRGDDLVLALEYVEGQDLATLLEQGVAFSQADVRDLLAQLGSALAAAHARAVIHRDIKPSNILCAPREGGGWRFVLTDFGIGQVREGIQARKQTGGTYLFMAPEQLRGRPGPQSDLWALGVVAYRLLAGRLPFPGPTVQELTRQILYGAVVSPSEVGGVAIDPALEKAVLHLLDRSQAERTGSAEELLAELGQRRGRDSTVAPRSAAPRGGRSLDRQIAAGIASRRALVVLCVVLYLLPSGLLASVLMLAGLTVFFLTQRTGRWLRPAVLPFTLLAYLLLASHIALSYVFRGYDLSLFTLFQPGPVQDWLRVQFITWVPEGTREVLLYVLIGVAVVMYIVYIFLPVIAGSLFAGMRRLQREKLLRDLAREEGTGSDRYLEALRQALDTRFEDVGLHLKYAEALFGRGLLAEAAVEARLLLRQDPYHFNGSLLLAHAYFGLQLYTECAAVCDGYLAVSGYCFEFGELREQCRRRAA